MDKPLVPQTAQPESKQSPQDSQTSLPPQSPTIDFIAVASRVFELRGGTVFIGGEEINKEMRGILKEEAKYIEQTQLWDIINATILNESANLALIQSTDWSHIESAKMLHHWGHVFKNMLHVLSKE